MKPHFNNITDNSLLDRLNMLHLVATEGLFVSTCLYEERALWFQDESWRQHFSAEFFRLLPNVEPAAVNTIKSPQIGPKAARLMENSLLGTDTGKYSVQLVRCSHIDWHDDREVAEKNNLHPGVVLFCLSDNPLNMSLYRRSKTDGPITSTSLKKGQALWLDDHQPHALLPDSPCSFTSDMLNDNPLSLVTFQLKKETDNEVFLL